MTMIKSDDPVKAIEQVPVLNEYFGSALVAHITISKDIFIGDDATEFNLEGEEASDLHKDSVVKKKNETVQSAGSKEDADTAKNVETKQEPETQPVEEQAAPQEEEQGRRRRDCTGRDCTGRSSGSGRDFGRSRSCSNGRGGRRGSCHGLSRGYFCRDGRGGHTGS